MTEARERALEALYEADRLGHRVLRPAEDISARAWRLANGVMNRIEELDMAINGAADRWTTSRMPVVDRAVLRLALYELRYEPETPTAVILSEAVRIAKEFSTESSGRFVNGVLSTLAATERP